MKVICVRLNSGEEVIGRVVDQKVMIGGSDDKFSGNGPWAPEGNITLEKVRGITAQQINKNEMAIAFFPWSLGNQDGMFTINLTNCAAAVYPAEKAVEDGYLEQTSNIKLARPGTKM
jgi:hypothetical protein